MKTSLTVIFTLTAIIALLAAGCTIENLPANNSNFKANLNGNNENTNNKSSAKNDAPAPNINSNTTGSRTPAPLPPESNTSLPPYTNGNTASTTEIIAVSKLIIPVEGIKKENLRDTFNDARSEGRVHNALDIMAAGGTPVLAATDGKIVKFHDSALGGITIYQESADNPRLVLYYAHLQRRADAITENMDVKKGTIIGYVGDTGNAGAGNYHLHFAMWVVDDPKRYWDGANVNPYDYLK